MAYDCLTWSDLQEVREVLRAHGLLGSLRTLRTHDAGRGIDHHSVAFGIAVHRRRIAVLVLQVHLSSKGVCNATAHVIHPRLDQLLHLGSERPTCARYLHIVCDDVVAVSTLNRTTCDDSTLQRILLMNRWRCSHIDVDTYQHAC